MRKRIWWPENEYEERRFSGWRSALAERIAHQQNGLNEEQTSYPQSEKNHGENKEKNSNKESSDGTNLNR